MTDNLEKKEEQILIQLIKSGNDRAFSQLVDKYKKNAFSIAYRYTSNVQDAEDLSQQAFIKVYHSIDRFREESNFYTWFYRVLVNLCMDFRKKRRLKTFSFSQTETSGSSDENEINNIRDDKIKDVSSKVLNEEFEQHLKVAIESLPGKQKTAFILSSYHDMSMMEIGEVLNCAVGTVKSHLSRAMKKIKQEMIPYVKEEQYEGTQ